MIDAQLQMELEARQALGRNIARARLRAGLTQEKLAARLGTSRAVVGQYETGVRSPRLGRLHEIATALGTTVSALTEEP